MKIFVLLLIVFAAFSSNASSNYTKCPSGNNCPADTGDNNCNSDMEGEYSGLMNCPSRDMPSHISLTSSTKDLQQIQNAAKGVSPDGR